MLKKNKVHIFTNLRYPIVLAWTSIPSLLVITVLLLLLRIVCHQIHFLTPLFQNCLVLQPLDALFCLPCSYSRCCCNLFMVVVLPYRPPVCILLLHSFTSFPLCQVLLAYLGFYMALAFLLAVISDKGTHVCLWLWSLTYRSSAL